jgi:MFS family permease
MAERDTPAGATAADMALVSAVGTGQVLAWGTTFYLLGVLAPFIVRDTGWRYDAVVGGMSLGMFVAGLVSPRIGRLIARHGGRPVLSASSAIIAAGLAGLGLAESYAAYLAAWAVVGVGMGAGLYDAAFSSLGVVYGNRARTAITAVTLFGGFASTVCWPLAAALVGPLGWRGACFAFALLHVLVALPLYAIFVPRKEGAATSGPAPAAVADVRLRPDEVATYALLVLILTIGSAILSNVGTHLLTLLLDGGVELAVAVALGAIVGPSQVGARVIEMFVGRRHHPVWTLVASVALLAVAALMLFLEFPLLGVAIALYGIGNGIGSIARGTVPLALFGAERYAVLMGRIALPYMIAMAVSPFLGGAFFQHGGARWTFGLIAGLAVLNVALTAALLLRLRSVLAAPKA